MQHLLKQGVICVLGREHAKRAFSARDNASLMAAITGALQSAESDQLAACRGEWEFLHRLFVGGAPDQQNGNDPLSATILGGRHLQRAPGLVLSMVRPDVVPIIADALEALGPSDFAVRCGQLDQAKVDQLWAVLAEITTVYRRASNDGSAVAFAVIGDVDEMQ